MEEQDSLFVEELRVVKLNSTSIGGDDVTCTTGSYHGGLALPSSPLQLFVLCRHMSDFCFDTDADCPFDVDAECPSSPELTVLLYSRTLTVLTVVVLTHIAVLTAAVLRHIDRAH